MNFLKYWKHYFYNQLPWNKVRFQPLSLSDEELLSLRRKVNQRMKKIENNKKKSTVAQSQLKQSVTSGKSLIDEAFQRKTQHSYHIYNYQPFLVPIPICRALQQQPKKKLKLIKSNLL